MIVRPPNSSPTPESFKYLLYYIALLHSKANFHKRSSSQRSSLSSPSWKESEMEKSTQSSALPTIELYGDEFWPLSGRPFFDIILTKSHIKPVYQLEIPAKLNPVLPAGTSVPMVLNFGDKSWEMTYSDTKRLKLVDRHSWGAFVDDNSLKAGDGCIFELTRCESTKAVFRVQILRGDIPAELVEKYSNEKPVII